jgi:3-phenylpropionate/trans-cinnamate dioxygenase ferredoxin reductase subunit
MTTIIVGAGHGGGAVAANLRQNGYTGSITLVGEEPHPPYQRPPLSKGWLKGEVTGNDLLLRPRDWYAATDIDLRTSTRVIQIDRAAKRVILSTDEALSYDFLVLATGAGARRLVLPGSDLRGFLELRTIEDAEAIKASFKPGFRLAIIGGGYIGLEVAASARMLGADVDVIEREDRVLARVAGSALSDFFRQVHQEQGVRFHFSARVEGFERLDGQVSGIRIMDASVLHCDAVLVGIGAIPNDKLARDAGLECNDGVIVDGEARTSDHAIFAIGDMTRRPVPLYGRSVRLESVPNVLEQARQAAAAICGTAEPKSETPWFWSDQYDLKLQIAGLAFDVDEVVVRGDPAARKFAVFHLSRSRVQAVEAINAPPEFIVGRQWLASRREIDSTRLANVSIPIKEV